MKNVPGPSELIRLSITAGSIIWLMLGLLTFLNIVLVGLIELLLLLAPLVIVPLGLRLVKATMQTKQQQMLYDIIELGQPVCALAVTIAFLISPGFVAGGLALPWLVLTAIVALLGGLRFMSRRYFDIAETAVDVGLVYLSIGGGWLIVSRLGLNPLGFANVIILLTAVHFHYAGFAALIITGVTGQHQTSVASGRQGIQRLFELSAFGVMVGTPIVAAGITLSPLLELVGAIVLAAALGLLAFLIGRIALYDITAHAARMLLTVSAFCLIIGMIFTCIYAISEFTGHYLVSIAQMAMIHGIANALGFALCGLLGWNISQTKRLNELYRSA